jgi:hypothetical protein
MTLTRSMKNVNFVLSCSEASVQSGNHKDLCSGSSEMQIMTLISSASRRARWYILLARITICGDSGIYNEFEVEPA